MIRGLWNHGGVLYSVKNDKLYSIDSAGLSTERGTLNSIGGMVDMESTPTQLCVNDGTYLYIWNPTTQLFSTAVGYMGGDRIAFLAERIIGIRRGTDQFDWSNVLDGATWDILNFATAETNPDKLVATVVQNGELWLGGEVGVEIWDPDPSNPDLPYAHSTAAIDYGVIGARTMQKTAKSVFWLGREGQGGPCVVMARGHQAIPVSTRSEEEKLEGLNLSQASAFTYADGSQAFYCLNVPGLDTTLTYDEKHGQWHDRAEWINGAYAKWRPTCHATAYGKHYFGSVDDRLYNTSLDAHTNAGDPLIRRRIAPVISKPTEDPTFFSFFQLICERGTGAEIQLRWSDDNGLNWSNWHTTTVGQVGDFAQRATWRALGSAHDRVFDVQTVSDAPFNPVELILGLD